MQSTLRRTPACTPLAASMLVACLLSVISPTHATEADTTARPATARDTARENIDRQVHSFNAEGDALMCRAPAFEHEPLRELIDKYAPSALEWSLLPHIAAGFRPHHPRRSAMTASPA